MSTMSLVEAFLLIEQPRQRLGHWTAALASLDSPLAPAPSAVVAYYDPTCDQALLNLQYDEAILGDSRLEFVMNVALLAEVGMVQPSELSEGERVRFLASRLTRCTIRITSQRSANGALTELVRKIKDERALPRAIVVPKGEVEAPVITAKGTRDNLEQLTDEDIADFEELDPLPEIDVDLEDYESGPSSRLPTVDISRREAVAVHPPELVIQGAVEALAPSTTTGRHVISRANRMATVESAPPATMLAADDPPAPPLAPLRRRAKATTENDFAAEDDERHMTGPTTTPAQHATPRMVAPTKRRAQSDPYLPTSQQPNMIYARYLRGGRWVPVRVGALSLKGAALLAGALPRVQDHVDIALSFGSHRALVRGRVAKVSTVREAAATGASTFSLAFELDEVSRRQLTALLVAARNAKITIKPPPPRATRRFPVEWNIALATPKGQIKTVALDVSTGGMFVRSPVALELGTTTSFSLLLDDGGAPVTGRATVLRRITDADARTCGLAPGFGLGIVEMSESDRMRWLGFLARIERRAEKRVLVGADPARLAELQAALASLGYAVSGGTDPGTLVQLANGDARPADAVLIDAGWLQNESSTTLVESLFSARNVPCVTMHGEVRRARQAIDRLLEVVV